MPIIMTGHEYRDEKGTRWTGAHILEGIDPPLWELHTGKGMLQRTARFRGDGTSVVSSIADLTEELGVAKPEVTDIIDKTDAYEEHQDQIRHTIAVGARYPHARYDQLVNETVQQIKILSQLKGGEYAGDEDRLANFRRNATDLGVPMEVIWRIYAAKHWDAIGQYIRDLGAETTRPRLEGLQGRCDDIIVYMILLKAMLEEAGVK